MKKYQVRIETTMYDYVIVEATDHLDAENKAWERLGSIGLGMDPDASTVDMFCSEDDIVND